MSSLWVKTSEAAQQLGISSTQLRRMLPQLKQGKHYRNMSYNKMRPTYRWNIQNLEKLFDEKKKGY